MQSLGASNPIKLLATECPAINPKATAATPIILIAKWWFRVNNTPAMIIITASPRILRRE